MNKTKKTLAYLGGIAFTILRNMAPYHGYLHNNLSCLEDKGCWCTLRHLLWWKCFIHDL